MALAKRVLVADDNHDAAQMLAVLVRLEGHSVCVANDGHRALEIAEEFRPQVGILDIGMPRMTGHDAARRIRERSWGRTMLLIAVSGWGQSADKRLARDAGFDHHLTKPADFEQVLALLTDSEIPRA